MHRMNSKLRNQKLTGWRSTKDEEWWRTFMETSRKRYRSTSALIFSFFLLLLTNFKWNMLNKVDEPLPLSLPCPFIAKIREELAAQLACGLVQKQHAHPGELVASCWSFLIGLDGPRAEENWLPERREILWITRKLALSSSTWLAKICMSTNNRPRTKLGYDSCPSLLIFYWR